MGDGPARWCSHSRSMVYELEECWCSECPARWVLTWKPPGADGRRVPKAWQYQETG